MEQGSHVVKFTGGKYFVSEKSYHEGFRTKQEASV